jgi:Kef-type K+ transport system membrane component KefB
MSITAFPVLARILEERQMQSTPLGTTALMCAAVDDVSAWIFLAIALTLVPHTCQSMGLPYRLLWLGIYLAVMFGGVRPLGKWLVERQKTALSYEVMGIILAVVLTSSAATEAIGVHPLFGDVLHKIHGYQEIDTVPSMIFFVYFIDTTD